MSMFTPITVLRYGLLDAFWLWMMRRHGTPMRSFLVFRFTHYWRKCQRVFLSRRDVPPQVADCAAKFRRDHIATYRSDETARLAASIFRKLKEDEASGADLWGDDAKYKNGEVFAKFPEIEDLLRDEVGDCFRLIYGSEFKVYHCAIIKKLRRRDEPQGSQLWHTDSHPGTCVKAMIHLNDVMPGSGATEFVPWPETVEIVHRVSKEWRRVAKGWKLQNHDERARFRTAKSELFGQEIQRGHRSRVEQPCLGPGSVVLFNTNILHRGGFPEPGHERYTLLVTVYPEAVPPPFAHYRDVGTAKMNNYPRDPAEVI